MKLLQRALGGARPRAGATTWFIALGIVIVAGCKEDPPPPPIPTPSGANLAPASDDTKARPHKTSAKTDKSHRAEICYFGTTGFRYLRDAYLASLGGSAPSAAKLPSFGDYKESKSDASRRVERMPRRELVNRRQRIPFMRFVNSCKILAEQHQEPAHKQLDAAATEFAQYITGLHSVVRESARYYNRKHYEKDEFKKGAELHEELVKKLESLDAQLDGFASAYKAWQTDLGELPDKLNENGKLAQAAVGEAHTLTMLMLAPEVNAESVTTSIEKLDKATAALEDTGDEAERKGPFARLLPIHLRKLIDTATEVAQHTQDGKLGAEHSYRVALAYARTRDASHRALRMFLGGRGKAGGSIPLPRPHLKKLRPTTGPLRPQPLKRVGE